MIRTFLSSRRPLFWILLSAIFIGGVTFSIKYFVKALPIVSLNISMSRKEALRAGKQLALKYGWGPQDFEQTAAFSGNDKTQNFIELEGGGKEMLNTIIKEKYYFPYTWQVRHFKEHETHEVTIEFTPEGEPYGFEEKIPETKPGAALSAEQARAIALKVAQKEWRIDFSLYKPVENSQETKPSGRIDHNFVYERIDKKVGEAPYRLSLELSGDRLTGLSVFIKVPEAFIRRYENMRSANNTIAQIAGTLALLLYFLGGCVFGLFFLLRRRWVIWNKAFLWSSFIALLSVLHIVSTFPLLWMNYDTALDKHTIYFQFILSLLITFGSTALGFGLIFAAAESLTRMAFGHQPQLWKLWSKQAASSIQVLGRTVGAYLVVGWDFLFTVAVYLFASRFLGWWSPSNILFDPNVLATYFPWISALARSLSAGFLEECLFRAIPLSCAALIGKKYGNRTAWISAAFILQALIFSAVHANYPAQPAYARLIELLVPSSVFGGIYLAFGLLPSIIAHFIYDVVLFALPILLSDMIINKVLVIFFACTPLLIVFGMRLRSGKWFELPKSLYNAAWQPSAVTIVSAEQKSLLTNITSPTHIKKILSIAGALGLACWLLATQFKQDGLPLAQRWLAQEHTTQAMAQKNIVLKDPWQQFSTVFIPTNEQHRFVWKTNKPLYWPLLHRNYLSSAQWKIRYAQFQGDIVNRAEEYSILLNPLTHVSPIRISHKLPESRAGQILSEEEARRIANTILKTEYHYNDVGHITEISAISKKQPARLDWIFTFSDKTAFPITEKKELQGQARIAIEIAGDQVVDHYQYVFVPEEWQRIDRQEQTTYFLAVLLFSALLIMLMIIGGVRAVTSWVNHRFATSIFLLFFGVLAAKSIIQFFNFLPSLMSGFTTSAPFLHQMIMLASANLIQLVMQSGIALLAGYIQNASMHVQSITMTMRNRLMLGFSLGSIIAGFFALIGICSPSVKPLWADYVHAAAQFPGISIALTSLTTFIWYTILLYLISNAIDEVTSGGTGRWWAGIPLSVLLGIGAFNMYYGIEHLASWFIGGILFGLLLLALYIVAFRFDRTLIPLSMGTFLIYKIVQQGIFNAYAGVFWGMVFSILLVMITALWWSKKLEPRNAQ